MIKRKLQELSISITSGLTPLRSNSLFWVNGEVPWLKTEQLGEKYIHHTNEHISRQALENTSIRLNPENTLSIAMYGEGKTRGNLSILKKPMTTNQACCNVVIDSSKAHYEYIYYYLKTQYEELRNLSSGVRKNLNSNDIKNYPIRLPGGLDVQATIANVLKALDVKIDLNYRINAELEAMAKTLYDYWFVQFDFPDANGKPYKTSGGNMIYNLNLKRYIPEGWSNVKLNKLLTNESISVNANQVSSDTPYTPIDYLPMKKMSFADYAPAHEANTSLIKYNQGDILIGAMRVYFHRVCIAPFNGITRSTSIVLRPKESKLLPYLYQVCNEEKTINFATKVSVGTQQPYVNWEKSLENYEIPFPFCTEIIEKYSISMNCIVNEIINREKENAYLSKLRDWLLPMLMNGQITVKQTPPLSGTCF